MVTVRRLKGYTAMKLRSITVKWRDPTGQGTVQEQQGECQHQKVYRSLEHSYCTEQGNVSIHKPLPQPTPFFKLPFKTEQGCRDFRTNKSIHQLFHSLTLLLTVTDATINIAEVLTHFQQDPRRDKHPSQTPQQSWGHCSCSSSACYVSSPLVPLTTHLVLSPAANSSGPQAQQVLSWKSSHKSFKVDHKAGTPEHQLLQAAPLLQIPSQGGHCCSLPAAFHSWNSVKEVVEGTLRTQELGTRQLILGDWEA